MDRNKSSSNSRGAKSKITQYPPDIFALGSKPTSSRDADSKRSGSSHKSSSSSHPSGSKGASERKREHSSSSLTNVPPSKKPKVGGPVIRAVSVTAPGPSSTANLPAADRPVSASAQPQSTVEFWETLAVECEPCDLVPNIGKALDHGDSDKVVSYLLGALKTLRAHRYKPDKVLYYGLLYIAKVRPALFVNDHVTAALANLLRRDTAHSFKSKGNPSLPVLCANLLLRAHASVQNWSELFVKLYVEDTLGDRIWVDHEECKGFVDNILTAFNTRIPPKSLLAPELSGALPGARDMTSSPVPAAPGAVVDEDGGIREGRNTPEVQAGTGLDNKENMDVPVQPRYAQAYEVVEQIVLEAIKDQLNRRQPPETVTRNFLRLLSSACGLVEIRMIAVSRLEMWLHNPKLMRPAQELLAYLCCNCASVSQRDMEVTAQLTKIRLKTKALVNVYLNCLRELITIYPDNLPAILRHTIYNELSNSRNPNNMPMIAVMFQAAQEPSAVILAEIFQDLLINKDDYLRSLRALLREIVRVLRFDINLYAMCRSLVRERKEITTALRDFEYRDRVLLGTGDLLCLAGFLGISPQVKEAAQLLSRGDKKEIATLQTYQLFVAEMQREAVTWLHEHVLRIFRPTVPDFMHVLHKVLFLEAPEQYYKIDMWPSESDRNFLLRLASESPLLQATLVRILLIGISKEHPLNAADTLELADQLIKRAALLPTDGFPALQADKLEIIDFIFNLSAYHYPENISLPQGYTPPQLAISNLYWKSWVMLLILSAHNPTTIGKQAWEKYPMLRTFMEMCITNHFAYPPPTAGAGENFDDIKNKELQVAALEKQQILEFESHLAAASTKITITEQNSLLLSQLIEMKPLGDPRHPPQAVLDQLHALNASHRMGHLLCRSRNPDFLLEIIQRQGSSQHMPWLADLVHNSEGALSHLPVQCLCEYLLISGMHPTDKNEKHKKHSQVLAHLQNVLTDADQEVTAACEILEYFLRRLNSIDCPSRVQAVKGLTMVLSTVKVTEEELPDEDAILDSSNERRVVDYWLMKQVLMLPHFHAIRPYVVASVRQACQIETDPEHVSSYINFLAHHTANETLPEMLDLVLDMSQLIVERSTLIAAVLPVVDLPNKMARKTLHSLMLIFCRYLDKAREPRQDTYTWSESQDQVLMTWPNGKECIMHILVVHAMIILLTYGPAHDDELFDMLLESWFPIKTEPPKAFLVDTSEEALLIPDWLKLRMIRSTVSRLVDAALINLEPSQLVLFIQSFGIPVSSMSKLLCMLDSAVTVDQTSVGEAVLDKCYMAQLVEVQHRRGATGGNTFVQVLQLQEPKLPDDIIIDTGLIRQPFPENLLITSKPRTSDTNSVVSLMNSIFLNAKYESDVDKDFGNLLKNLGEEIHNNYISTKKTLKVLTEYFISNVTSSDFVVRLLVNEGYSCTIFRLILSNKYNTTELSDLARNMLNKIADKKCSLAVILTNFLRKQQKKARVEKDLNTEFNKDTIDVLKKTDLVSLERTTKALVEKSLEKSDNVGIVNAMCKLLLTDVETNKFERTGLLVDWIAELEMEIIGTLPDLQMELLFAKSPVKLSNVRGQHWMSFRPYLLTLLTHRVSWRALHACVLRLLAECLKKYDPSAVLDFLWALTCNPKLWQGRDKFTPKNYKPENVLQLSNQQILVLVDYILEEAYQANDLPPYNDKNSVHKIEQRLPLLLQSLGDRSDAVSYVVRHLVATMAVRDETDAESQVINLDDSLSDEAPEKPRSVLAQEFLVLLYMRIPRVIHYIPDSDKKNMENVSKITEYSTSVIDKITHSLFTALASTPRSKDWPRKSQEFELLTRKMAAVHPSLVLRQLPMIAASLKGRTHLDFNVFKSRNHLNLFVQILGIVELLQPAVFEEDYRDGLEGVLMAYFFLFRYHGYVKELHSILGKFVSLLQAYVSYDAPRALKYLQRHAHLLNDLHLTYSNLRPLRVLMSSISLPKEENPLIETSGESGEVLVAVARAPSPEPAPPNWHNLVQSITRLDIDELPNVLQEIDHISNRRPAILESIVEQICSLILSPSSSVRQLGHVLLLRYLRHNPASVDASSPVLAAVLQSLETNNADVINSILEKLPDYVICLQEHAVRILEKAFLLGVKSNISTTANISKAIAVLNIQSGC